MKVEINVTVFFYNVILLGFAHVTYKYTRPDSSKHISPLNPSMQPHKQLPLV